MKITFAEQTVRESERYHMERSRSSQANEPAAAAQNAAAFFGAPGGMTDVPGMSGEKKSLIELQQEASYVDVGVQRDYMTVMSHTMSEEDYAKLQEEGFDFGGMEPEEAVTIVDKIKAELARAGKDIQGYTDDVDMEVLAAALGSQGLAQAVADSFREADLPLTRENLSALSGAWAMSSGLQPMEDGSCRYLIDNEMEAEIWNLYLAQSSGAGRGSGAPRFYQEDVKGYYTRSAGAEPAEELQGQIDRIIEQSGREVNEESREAASWLLEKGLPLTPENLERLEELRKIELPVTEEQFAEAAAAAVAEGKDPVHASLAGRPENLYEKAAALSEYYHGDEIWEASAGNLAARRQLEEIRLRMTAEVNLKLLKSGFSIDSAPMEELIEALRRAEEQLAGQYFPGDEAAVEKYQSYHLAQTVTEQLPGLPADVLGMFAEGQGSASLETVYRAGRQKQEGYEKARESYEKLMTAPRSDLGDNIRKAFRNVDDILKDLGLELTEENRRAVRILGYNRMEVTVSNLEAVREADRQVQNVIDRLTPAATLKMIRDGFNPLEKSFGELEQYFESLPGEYREEAESYSRFLYNLERNDRISQEERESYIGIYRLVHQIQKREDAAVGALVNSGAEIHFANLLSAVKSARAKGMDVRVAEETQGIAVTVRRGENLEERISGGFARNAEGVTPASEAGPASEGTALSPEAVLEAAEEILAQVSPDAEAEREYDRMQLETLRRAVSQADQESYALLQRGELPANADNLMAVQALEQGTENLFERLGRRKGTEGRQGEGPEKNAGGDSASADSASAEPVGEGVRLWERLDDGEGFREAYGKITQESLEAVQEETFARADTNVDVRSLQLVHKQLTVAAALAEKEEFFLPMYVGDRLGRVHLTLNREESGKGSVAIGVSFSEEEHIQARLSVDNGTVRGTILGDGKVEVMKLRQIADNFRKKAEGSWTVGELVTAAAGKKQPEGPGTGEHARTENAELYRVAKVFLQSLVQ